MRNRTVANCILALFCGIVFAGGTHALAGPKFKSAKPRFARVSVTKDDSKILNVVFDESKGTGKGYDTLYADTNFNGKFDEKAQSTSPRSLGRGGFISSFKIGLNVSFSNKIKTIPNSNRIYFGYVRFPENEGSKEIFTSKLEMKTGHASKIRWYMFSSEFNPSTSFSSAPVRKFKSVPRIQMESKPDIANKGNTGFAIKLFFGDMNMHFMDMASLGSSTTGVVKNESVSIIIKDSSRKLIRHDKGGLDKFAFG